MKTLELFNCVEARPNGEYKILTEYGVIIEPSASYALPQIKKFLESKMLNGQQLNATFHKSWKVIKESSREELWMHQLLHYITTYGTGFQSSFVYLPNEDLDVPQMETKFLVIRGLNKEQIIEKALDLFKSGVALKQETIYDVLEILNSFKYEFTGKEDIKNKEALMFVCKEKGIVPTDPSEFVRYMIYLATGNTLLIKNKDTYSKIAAMTKDQKFHVIRALLNCDVESLAEVFNRFKPIFLAFKKVLGGESARIINKISRLSKKFHVPMKQNILNNIASCSVTDLMDQKDNLVKNANFFQLARCLQYLKQVANADCRVYNIRNGKSYTKEVEPNSKWFGRKMVILQDIIFQKFGSNLKGKKIYIPDSVYYALPTSEKMFVGNVPMGTKFVSEEPIAMGIYWKNSGGARDLDLSSISTDKVGWNARFSSGNNANIMFSGDMTNASSGATEYIRVKKIDEDHLILNNVYSGNDKGSVFNIIVGRGANINKKYMMDPNNVWFTTQTETIQRQTIVGMLSPHGKGQAAIVLNFASGAAQVSNTNERSRIMRSALAQRWKNCFYLNELLEFCGAVLVDSPEECDVDLTPSNLEKDTILNFFKN